VLSSDLDHETTALDARVRTALAGLHPGIVIGELATLPGGHSGLTYRITAAGQGYVVKAVPPGSRPLGRNDVLRQAEVLRALAPTDVPVPRVVAASDTHPGWFAMTMAAGDSTEPVLDEHTLAPELVRARMLALAEVQRTLHAVDVAALGLSPQPVLGAAGELERWTRTLLAVPDELVPGRTEVLHELATRVPTDVPGALVHGDLRLGNVLCEGVAITAVIDWEIWGIGDPRIDLAWFLLFADPANFPGVGSTAAGLPSEDELLEVYRGGGEPPRDMRWFRALGRMKMAAIMAHNLKRHREGKHHDPEQERLPPTIAAMLRSALALLCSALALLC